MPMPRRPLARLAGLVLALVVAKALADGTGPEEAVRDRADRVMAVLHERGAELETDPKALYALVDELILPLIDFEAMAKLTLGKHWRDASPEQRDRFVGEYRTLLVRTYTKSLLEVRDKSITYLPNRNDPKSDYATVATEVQRGGGQPNLPVTYSLRKVGGHWLVYDVTIEGLSLVKNYRTSFSSEIDQVGLTAFLDRLEATNREAASGS